MYSYTYTKKRDFRPVYALICFLFASGLSLIYLSKSLSYPFIAQLFAFFALASGIFLTTRYVVKKYTCSIINTQNGYDFAIYEIQGKKSTAVCRFSFDSVTDFIPAEKNGAFPESVRKDKEIRKFNYCQNLFETDAYVIVAELDTAISAVKFSPDKKLVSLINSLRPKDFDKEKADIS